MGLKEKLEELASKQYRRVARGLDPSEVEFSIRQAADLAQELIQRNEAMEKELVEFREQEGWMKRTLLHAEKIASAIQGEAATEAATIRAKAEIEAAEVVDQARKKAEVQERVLISRRTLVEKRMALYEHESNLLLYRLYDLAKHHVDELGQEVSSEVKSLLQRMGTDWEMLPQLPFPASEDPSNPEVLETKQARMETPPLRITSTEPEMVIPPVRTVLEPVPPPPQKEPFIFPISKPPVAPTLPEEPIFLQSSDRLSPSHPPSFVSSAEEKPLPTILREEPIAADRVENQSPAPGKESVVLRTLEGAPSIRTTPDPRNSSQAPIPPTSVGLINFANPLEELAAITAEEESTARKNQVTQPITSPAFGTLASVAHTPPQLFVNEPTPKVQIDAMIRQNKTAEATQKEKVEEVSAEKKPPIANDMPSSTSAWGEERQRVEESLLCGRRLVREIRDTQGRLVVGSGALVTRELIHFLIGKGLYGELVASVSDEKDPAR